MLIGVPPIGGACVAGETIIEGPDGDERIDVLAERGGEFLVWSLTPEGERVAATVPFAFKKGRTELFEFTFANGRTLTATSHHRWLTRDGWRETGETSLGTEIALARPSIDRDVRRRDLPAVELPDSAWIGVEESDSVEYVSVLSMKSVGTHDFYDMTVPTWGNYLGNGIWNHNTDAVLQPLYWDTILAWMHFRSPGRVLHSGWARPFEYRASSGDRAYTLEALLSLRKAFHETRSWFSHEVLVRDGAPWYIGDNGKGHYFLGDRIGAQVVGDFASTIYVDRVRELTLAWDRDSFAEWKCTIGEKEKNKDRGQRALGLISDLFAVAHDIGVLGR